jgi:hypothetical protein
MIIQDNLDTLPENYLQQVFDGSKYYFLENEKEVEEFISKVQPVIIDGVITEGATDSDLNKVIIEAQYQKYVQRKIDGEEYHLRICAELRVMKLGGGITQAQYDAIYASTAPTRNEVVAGQWLSGLKEFEKLNGVLSVGLYNRIHTDITNYIQIHYA